MGDFTAIQELVENNDVKVAGIKTFHTVFDCAKMS